MNGCRRIPRTEVDKVTLDSVTWRTLPITWFDNKMAPMFVMSNDSIIFRWTVNVIGSF